MPFQGFRDHDEAAENDDDETAEDDDEWDLTHVLRRGMHPFEALAEPVRRRLVDIVASGEHTSGQLAEVIGKEFHISRTAVSKHLRLLRDAGLVDVRADLSWRWYRLAAGALDLLDDAIEEIREKSIRAVGWNPDTKQDHDPLAHPPLWATVPVKGPGRAIRRGNRGRQTDTPEAPDPDQGLFPVHRL